MSNFTHPTTCCAGCCFGFSSDLTNKLVVEYERNWQKFEVDPVAEFERREQLRRALRLPESELNWIDHLFEPDPPPIDFIYY